MEQRKGENYLEILGNGHTRLEGERDRPYFMAAGFYSSVLRRVRRLQ